MKETVIFRKGPKKSRKVRLISLTENPADESPVFQTQHSFKLPNALEEEYENVLPLPEVQLKSAVGRRQPECRSSKSQKLVAKITNKVCTSSPQQCLTASEEGEIVQSQNAEIAKVPKRKLSVRTSLKALDDLRVAAYASHRTASKGHSGNPNLGEQNRMPPPSSNSSLPGIASDLSSFMQGAFQASASRRHTPDELPKLAEPVVINVANHWLLNRTSTSMSSLSSHNINENVNTLKPKQPLSDRLKRVNLRRSKRMKKIRNERTLELKIRRYNALPKSESSAIEKAFHQFDKNRGYLDLDKIIPCLKELGVLGKTLDERIALKQIIECPVEGCTRPPCNWASGQPCCQTCQEHNGDCHDPECDQSCSSATHIKLEEVPAKTVDAPHLAMTVFLNEVNKGKTTENEAKTETASDEEDLDVSRGIGLSLYDFALTVLPQARQKLLELRSGNMLKQFFMFDNDGSGQLSHEETKELAGRLGIDQRMVDSLCDAQDEIDFEQFQQLIAKGKEKVDRMVRLRERKIQDELGINDNLFEDFRNDLASLHQLFEMYDTDESGALSMNEVMCMIKEFGLKPKTKQENDDINSVLQRNDVNGDGEFNFVEFLELVREVRAYKRGKQHQEYLQNFERYDKDKSGTLSVLEISNLLADLGFVPKSYKEQDEIAYLIHTADDDASGFINFPEFQVLCQRIDEKLKSMRYEEEIEYAMKLGFSEQHIRDLRWIFDSLDTDGSGKLDFAEVRHALGMMRKSVPSDVFSKAFKALDSDGSGELDFQEFMGFMQMMRDNEGLFAEEAQKLAHKAIQLDTRVLKRVLEYFHLSGSYISSLEKDELASLFCDFLGIADSSTDLHHALGIRSVGDLFDLVKKRAEGGATRREGH